MRIERSTENEEAAPRPRRHGMEGPWSELKRIGKEQREECREKGFEAGELCSQRGDLGARRT